MITYTPLELSKKIKELEIEVESENDWVGDEVWNKTEQSEFETVRTPHRSTWIPAYHLGELPAVLKAIGEVKGWEGEITYTFQIHRNLSIKPEKKEFKTDKKIWQHHFLEICRIYSISPADAWKYLEEIVNK